MTEEAWPERQKTKKMWCLGSQKKNIVCQMRGVITYIKCCGKSRICGQEKGPVDWSVSDSDKSRLGTVDTEARMG